MTKTILIVVTNHDRLGDTGKPTGLWLEELATPRARFLEAGYAVALASPLGGKTPIDPASLSDEAANDDTRAFLADDSAMAELESTAALNTLHPDRYDAVFCVGGHGTVFDFPDCRPLAGLATQFIASDRPFAAVCHGVAALLEQVAARAHFEEDELERPVPRAAPVPDDVPVGLRALERRHLALELARRPRT